MAKRRSYPETSLPMIIEVEVETHPNLKQLQDWKDLCT